MHQDVQVDGHEEKLFDWRIDGRSEALCMARGERGSNWCGRLKLFTMSLTVYIEWIGTCSDAGRTANQEV